MAKFVFTEAQSKPGFTADGVKWYQQCMWCGKQINFIKMKAGAEWLQVGQYVRHKRCLPPPIK